MKKEFLLKASVVIMVTAIPCMMSGFLAMGFVNLEVGYHVTVTSMIYFGIGSALRKVYHMWKDRDEKTKP